MEEKETISSRFKIQARTLRNSQTSCSTDSSEVSCTAQLSCNFSTRKTNKPRNERAVWTLSEDYGEQTGRKREGKENVYEQVRVRMKLREPVYNSECVLYLYVIRVIYIYIYIETYTYTYTYIYIYINTVDLRAIVTTVEKVTHFRSGNQLIVT